MTKSIDSKNPLHDLITLPNALKMQQDAAAKSNIQDHNLLNLSNSGITQTHISITDGDFSNINVSKDVQIDGNLYIEGQLKAGSINMDSTDIILSMDYNRIIQNLKFMDDKQLELLKEHLKKLDKIIEREQFDRT